MLIAAALGWTSVGAVAALLLVLPAPTARTWRWGVLLTGSSLVVVLYGVLGAGLATVAWVTSGSTLGAVAGAMAVATIALGLVPVVHGLRAARTHHVPLSARGYLSRPAWRRSRSPESLTYAEPHDAPGGLRVDVWCPRGAAASSGRAAVVTVHGGGWTAGGRGGMARWNEWLADLGYVVFDVDYRLAPPPRWRDAPGDVQASVAWVQARAPQLGVDPERVALLGWSAGGHLALLAAYDAPSACPPVAAVVALYPITDLTLTNRPWPRWSIGANGDVAQFLGAPAATVPERAAAASPVSHATADGPATFLVHGRRDQMVPVEHSRRLADALSAVGADHEYVELAGANHAYDLSWGAWSTQITRALIAAFLERALR